MTKTLNTVFDEIFQSFPATWSKDANEVFQSVPVNISESAEGFNIELSAPGRNKEDIKINVEKNILTISHEKKEDAEKKDKTIRREFSYGGFKRSFTIDEKINAEGIEAKYENGILRVFLPKKEEVKVLPKQISVQ